MEGTAETQTKNDVAEAPRSHVAIRCAKAALLLSSLKSSPNRRRLNAGAIDEDIAEKERMKKEIGDLKMEVARERVKNKRIKVRGAAELFVQLVLLLAVSTFAFVIIVGNGALRD